MNLIGVIFGEKGTGKTKQLLDRANAAVLKAKGNVIFIDSDNSYMYDLSTKVRFINATDYGVTTPKMLYGFLCGLAAGDFDLETVFIDGLLSIVHHSLDTLEGLFAELHAFSDKHGVNIILSMNGSADTVPAFLRADILETR